MTAGIGSSTPATLLDTVKKSVTKMSANMTDSAEAMEGELLPGQSAQVPQGVCETLAPQRGRPPSRHCLPVRTIKWHLRSMKMQVNFPPCKADILCKHLGKGQEKKDRGHWVAVLRSFIYACRPYFNFLESTARTLMLSSDIERVQLLAFSQQMCDTVERLVLNFASRKLLTLDETEPDNMSHFCIGQIQLDQLKLSVTMFRYCKPTPYLARVNTGVYKRMRWNVERLDGAHKPETNYYLCYEDVPNLHVDGNKSDSTGVRMWSIGQWVQVKPDPSMEDIFDWVLCDVPVGAFKKLLFVGKHEPSSCTATDQMLQLLTSQEDVSSQSSSVRSFSEV
ncbi:UPF0575 protein C19orf67 homolog isoform X2 [Phyllopteryx taeniolatus]|uniref:UPF0575 protein C19orf67 homolog isoform X2 n=1 Tax=Phyllopteryx taeniolatus TaxID=161469 RepID=UPI002AD34A8D|nr:UPF0575 protein C19orf67 homolog isoform X2 [Phyllopteryx taeniolatus]